MAILFLGPDKLPSTMIEIAKFFKSVKNTIGTVKDSIEDEINVSEIKKEALAYKKELLSATEKINKVSDIPAQVTQNLHTMADDILIDDDEETTPKAPKEPEEVTFKKKTKKIKKEEDNIDV